METLNIWFYIGIALLIWAISDLLAGQTWSYRKIMRIYEPGMYWFFAIFWFVVALSAIWVGLGW